MLYNILRDYKMLNCEVLVRDENGKLTTSRLLSERWLQIATVDDFIDVIMKDHRKYIKWYVYELRLLYLPLIPWPQSLRLQQNWLCLSRFPWQASQRATHCRHELWAWSRHPGRGREMLARAAAYENLYEAVTDLEYATLSWGSWEYRKGEEPDFSEALIVRSKSSIEEVCDQVHRTLKETFKYAMVWGASARHVPQRVGLSHIVADEDVVSIVAK